MYSDKLQEEARKIALDMLKQDQRIIRTLKQLMNRAWRTDLYAGWCLEEAEFLKSMQIRLEESFKMEQVAAITRAAEKDKGGKGN